MDTTVAILGFGPAAVNACIALRSAGYEGAIDVFSNTDTLPYSPVLCSKYAGGAPYEHCFPWTQEQLAQLQLTVHANEPVELLDPAAHTITTAQGTYTYVKCLIATGSSPTRKGFLQAEGFEPCVLRTLDDAARIRTILEERSTSGGANVLVSGTSMVAMKTIEACLTQGAHVTLLGRSNCILRTAALPEIAVLYEKALADKGVVLRLAQTAVNAQAGEDGIVSVTFSDGSIASFDLVILAHGMKPNLGFVAEGSLALDAGALVNGHMRTSDPDVYAAGDVAQALDLSTGERRIVAIWKNACVQGEIAGAAIAAELAGLPLDAVPCFEGSFPNNDIGVQNIALLTAGRINDASTRVTVCEEHGATVASIYDGDQLIGYNVFTLDGTPGSPAYDIAAGLRRQL